ncbi:hypothetical protein [Dactylosporangium fulvum]|uniref:hypothetical protein n=1 Tax=Dactylosporangium fulvum TaxID=53359 RepID=UPI0031D2C3FE
MRILDADIRVSVAEYDLAAEERLHRQQSELVFGEVRRQSEMEELKHLAHRVLANPALARAYVLVRHPSLAETAFDPASGFNRLISEMTNHSPLHAQVRLGVAFAQFIEGLSATEARYFSSKISEIFRDYGRVDLVQYIDASGTEPLTYD